LCPQSHPLDSTTVKLLWDGMQALLALDYYLKASASELERGFCCAVDSWRLCAIYSPFNQVSNTLSPSHITNRLLRNGMSLLWAFPCLFLYVFHLCLLLPSSYFFSHDYSFTLAIVTQPILFLVTQGRYSSISSIVILCIPYTLPTCSLPYCPQVFAFHCNLSLPLRL
jgi:hypothetical protein